MYGSNIGSLAVYTSTKSNPMIEVNRITGEQGDRWIILDTNIDVTLQSKEWVRIIIEASVGSGAQGRKTLFFFLIDSLFIFNFFR
jgi:hypothetical protein